MNTELQMLSCPKCGALNPPGNRFCGMCGQPVGSDPLYKSVLPQPQLGGVPAATQPPLLQGRPAPDARHGWKIWLIGAIVIALVGTVVAVVLPLVIISHQNGSHQVSSTHFIHCEVGTDYNPTTGEIQGAAMSFSASQIQSLYLVCFVDTHANLNDASNQLVDSNGNTITTFVGDTDTLHGVYYTDIEMSELQISGSSFTWKVLYADVPEISVDFQLTS